MIVYFDLICSTLIHPSKISSNFIQFFILYILDDELISDSFPMKEVDDVVFEVQCRQARKAAVKFDIGANPATGEGEAATEETEAFVEDLDESPINDIVDAFKLCETGFSKKDYMTYLKSYLKAIRAKLEETNPDRVAAFEAGSQVYAKKILGNFDNFRFFQGENMDPEAMVCLLGTREDNSEYFIFWKDGLRAAKY